MLGAMLYHKQFEPEDSDVQKAMQTMETADSVPIYMGESFGFPSGNEAELVDLTVVDDALYVRLSSPNQSLKIPVEEREHSAFRLPQETDQGLESARPMGGVTNRKSVSSAC